MRPAGAGGGVGNGVIFGFAGSAHGLLETAAGALNKFVFGASLTFADSLASASF